MSPDLATLPAPETALFTDLYELTMSASYFAHGLNHEASFELSVRRLPETRRFLVLCGLDDALSHLENLRFDDGQISYLASLGLFRPDFLDHLATLRFTGDVWAIPEGEIFFGGEPVLEVTAPLLEAQLVETCLINCITSQSMVASKAARVALACGDKPFVDFAARRAHGYDAALKGARASVVGGAAATSLVVAGRHYELDLSGTMAHAYVMSFDKEIDAFRAYARDFPGNAILLIDTYDTVAGAYAAVQVAHELAEESIEVHGVRLDSGDLIALSKEVRSILDDGGLAHVSIFASGDLDEYRITELLGAGAPVDAFGVGTQMGTSADAPSLGGIYKLVHDADGPKMKMAEGKITLPGRKQVHRFADHDVVSLRDELVEGGRPLLQHVMAGGRRIAETPPVATIRDHCREAVGRLPSRLRTLQGREEPYHVERSPALDALVDELTAARR